MKELYKKMQKMWVEEVGLEVGDTVKVIAPFENKQFGVRCQYGSAIDDLGKTLTVKRIFSDSIHLSSFCFHPFFCLEKITKPKQINMTVAEIEAQLDIKNLHIVKGDE